MATKTRKTAESAKAPLRFKKWTESIREIKAKRPQKGIDLLIARYSTGSKLVRGMRLERKKGTIDLVTRAVQAGEHFFPPSIKTVRLNAKKRRPSGLNLKELDGYRPEHLALRPVPKRLSRGLQDRRSRGDAGADSRDDLGEPGTIFAPDTRYIFSDTASPVYVRPRSNAGQLRLWRYDWAAPHDDG